MAEFSDCCDTFSVYVAADDRSVKYVAIYLI